MTPRERNISPLKAKVKYGPKIATQNFEYHLRPAEIKKIIYFFGQLALKETLALAATVRELTQMGWSRRKAISGAKLRHCEKLREPQFRHFKRIL